MADFYLLIVTLLAAGGWIFSKEALMGLPPLLFVGTRFFLAGLVIAFFCAPRLRQLTKEHFSLSLKAGLVFAVAMSCWIHGLHNSDHVGEGAFLTSLAVVIVPIFAKFWFQETPPNSTWIALPVSIIGLGFLSLQNGFHLEAGQLFFLVAAVLFALQFNLNTQAVEKVGALPLTSIQLMVVGVVAFSLSVGTETWPESVESPIIGWLLASALIATSARFLLQTHAQALTPASHAAVILTIEPVWTSILAAYWFGETMSLNQLIGCGCIFAALVISRWRWIIAMMKARH